MNKPSVRSAGNILLLALVTGWLFTGLSSLAEAAPTLTLQQAVHFAAADGSDVMVDAGTYTVDALEDSRLRLNAEGRTPLFLDAGATTHSEKIEAPLAVTVPGEDPDLLHVVLLLPNGRALDAPGSISGTRPRGTSPLMFSQFQFHAAVLAQAPQAPQAPEVRDHRMPSGGTPPSGGIRRTPRVVVPEITAPTTGTMAPPDRPSVVLYEHPNFGGRSQTLDVGGHILSDFNEIASSIQVPTGLVAFLYEHVDAGGGYGLSIDLLEDHPDLSQVNVNDKLSYVCVFSSPTSQGYIWGRASVQNGQFVAGHWERQRVGGTPVNTTAVVAPPIPPHPPGAPPASCGGGPIVRDHRPLHIVAIGDSIMWGQGLHEKSKFYTKVKIWLETQLGKPVEVHNAAHSGAKLFPRGNESEDIVLPGEVPFSSPTIVYQGSVRAPGLVAPENVNLVLMDGCINDIGVAKILLYTSDDNDLRRETQEACFTSMLTAMTAMSQKYPNAKLTVTGYYPIVSPQSSLFSIGPLLQLHGVPLDPLTGIASVHKRLTARSRIFADESSKALQQAVAIMNQRASNRFRFVPIPFSDMNAYGAPHSLLWLIPIPPAVDEVYKLRLTACTTIHIVSPSCIPASTGHPNVAGAQVYANSIAGVLRQFVNEWK